MALNNLILEFNELKKLNSLTDDFILQWIESKKVELTLEENFLNLIEKKITDQKEAEESEAIMEEEKSEENASEMEHLDENKQEDASVPNDAIPIRTLPKSESPILYVENIPSVKDGETIREFDIPAYMESYPCEFPPKNDLLNKKEINLSLLDKVKITKAELLYFRTLTHPFKQTLQSEDQLYLDYLISIEDWKIEWIQYLTQDLNVQYEPKDYSPDELNEAILERVELYIENLEKLIETESRKDKPLITINLNPQNFIVQINPKITVFNKDMSLNLFLKIMRESGFGLNPKKIKNS